MEKNDYWDTPEYEHEVSTFCYDIIPIYDVEWLWYPYIPKGKVTILQGDPGEGKTTLAMHLAAMVSRGIMYGDKDPGKPHNVIYHSAEDGLQDTIKPRLINAKADCRNIYGIHECGVPLTLTDGRLAAAIEKYEPALVILDPLQAYLGSEVDMHRANEIRPVMSYLANLAEQYECAILLIGHMNKKMGDKAIYRGLGSIDVTASARSVLLMARDPKETDVRVLIQIKSSLAKEGKPMAFRMTEQGMQWEGVYTEDVENILTADAQLQSPNKLEKAVTLLQDVLKDGEVPSSEVEALARKNDISKGTLTTARKKLQCKYRKVKGKWLLSLPGCQPPADEPEPTPPPLPTDDPGIPPEESIEHLDEFEEFPC